MSSSDSLASLDDSLNYTTNPLFKYHEKSDYSVFYATLFLCFFLTLLLLVINVYFCCFSEHKHYWTNSYTGNYFILPFWVRTPSEQAPIDLQELEWVIAKEKATRAKSTTEYFQLEKKESDI